MSSVSKPDTGMIDPAIVEAIVRQVMERLAVANVQTLSGTSPDTIAETAEASPVLELKDKVVTLDSLRGKLKGTSRIRIAGGAIVTPAAKDEIKLHGIQLEACDKSSSKKSAGKGRFCLARLGSHFVPLEWLKPVGLHDVCYGSDYEQIAGKLAQEHAHGKSICLAAQPYVAVSVLNRNQNLRVAMGRTLKDVAEINATLNANVLVLDSVQNREELLEMIRSFVSDQRGAKS